MIQLFLGQAINTISSYFVTIIWINQLKLTDYADYVLMMSLVAFFGQIIIGPTTNTINRYILNNQKAVIDNFKKLLWVKVLVICALSLIYKIEVRQDSRDLIIFIFLIITQFTHSSGSSLLNMLGRKVEYAIILASEGFTKLILTLIFYYLLTIGYESVVIIIVSVNCILIIMQFVFLSKLKLRLIEKKNEEKNTVDIRSFTWTFVFTGVFAWSYYNLQKWLISIYIGKTELALYNVSYQLWYLPISILGALLLVNINPYLFNDKNFFEDKKKQ